MHLPKPTSSYSRLSRTSGRDSRIWILKIDFRQLDLRELSPDPLGVALLARLIAEKHGAKASEAFSIGYDISAAIQNALVAQDAEDPNHAEAEQSMFDYNYRISEKRFKAEPRKAKLQR